MAFHKPFKFKQAILNICTLNQNIIRNTKLRSFNPMRDEENEEITFVLTGEGFKLNYEPIPFLNKFN